MLEEYKKYEETVFGGEDVTKLEEVKSKSDQLQGVIKQAMLTSASLPPAPAAV